MILVDPIIIAAAPRLFPAIARYTGVALSISIVVCVFGGTMPAISTYLLNKTQANLAPAIYLAGIGFISFIALQIGRRHLQYDQVTG